MIDVDLPNGPGSPLVRGFAACLSSVTELPLAELLQPVDDRSLPHALSSWKSWLAGRGYGLVPIADPTTFQWAGWWIAVINHSPAEDGPQQHVAGVAFGTPPGIVLSPQDPNLLGQATAGLRISSAFAVASLNPAVPPLPQPALLAGTVQQIAIAPDATAPMNLLTTARALTARGLEGDRYAQGVGTFSSRTGRRPGYDLTLIAAEDIEELTTQHPHLDFASTRRNILTRDIDVAALVGREFTIGDVRCHGLRLAEPCAHLEQIAGPGLLRPLIHRGGLRADVLSNGVITIGDTITT